MLLNSDEDVVVVGPDYPPYDLALLLANKVRTDLRRHAQISINNWTQEFEKLIKKHSQSEVTETLQWYIVHLTEPGMPIAHSAPTFKKKYDQIRSKFLQAQAKGFTLSFEAKRLKLQLEDETWPPEMEMHLGVVIETSLRNYTEFWKRVSRDAHIMPGNVTTLLAHLLETRKLCPPESFVYGWMHKIQSIIGTWDHLTSDPLSFAFTTDSKWFHQMGTEWAFKYCRHPLLWENLMKEVTK